MIPPTESPLVVYELLVGGESHMYRHPILQSLTVDHLACMGLVVRALHQMILLLVCHTIAPLITEQHPVPALLITAITVCFIGILVVVILIRLHPRWIACPQTSRNLWMLQVSVHPAHLQTSSPVPPLWDGSCSLPQSSAS